MEFQGLIGTWPGRYLVIEPTSFKKSHWCDNYQRSVFKILRSHELLWGCKYELLAAFNLGFSKGKPGYESIKGYWRGDQWWKQRWKWWDWMCAERTILWLRCSSTIQWSYGNTHLTGSLVLNFTWVTMINPYNFEITTGIAVKNLYSLYLNSHPTHGPKDPPPSILSAPGF